MDFKKLIKWVGRRVREKSTYVGLAGVAAALGFPAVADTIGQVGTMAVVILGTGLAAAHTAEI